jgi:hypothetical protein
VPAIEGCGNTSGTPLEMAVVKVTSSLALVPEALDASRR